jgi:hypothetical protein
MSFIMVCPNGHCFQSRAFVLEGNDNSVSGVSESCPFCNLMAKCIDGTYSTKQGQITEVKNVSAKDKEILTAILQALKSPAIISGDRTSLRNIADAVKARKMGEQEAEEAVSKLSPAFANIFLLARQYGLNQNLVFFLISFALALYASYDSNVTGDQAHSDALRIEETLNDDKAIQEAILRRLEEVLSQQRTLIPQEEKPIAPKWEKKKLSGSQTISPNRHERRKAARIRKKKLR